MTPKIAALFLRVRHLRYADRPRLIRGRFLGDYKSSLTNSTAGSADVRGRRRRCATQLELEVLDDPASDRPAESSAGQASNDKLSDRERTGDQLCPLHALSF